MRRSESRRIPASRVTDAGTLDFLNGPNPTMFTARSMGISSENNVRLFISLRFVVNVAHEGRPGGEQQSLKDRPFLDLTQPQDRMVLAIGAVSEPCGNRLSDQCVQLVHSL